MAFVVGRLEVPNDVKPTFDPNLGFEKGRKQRVVPMTETEMAAAHIPPKERGYCADTYMKHRACLRNNMPFSYFCRHEMHNYHHCMEDDYIMRFKEYEREKRLRTREQRIQAANGDSDD
uniref:NADH dehydrogenase [ubiquinone] 1 beta subcomplex subunit 7 n=1 Tax=Caligus rogercresseyi TaxID=217165 RepID=C1BQ07_CALRO|nr:NADH dehydrogenase 1 beta subcomplex subunit 7 [Caligus rogercresseyi]|eukprot:TRINITY_DN2760_c0_g1_i1.p1 TRINITY_DN2760_c0_g1~~TRINITY_DN2760_c0_g1_i1.p1  ORF type:complete len:131 (+),score=21.26 TRINITY_DN2760_c0_g1_i1:37-393(+)